MTLTLNLLMTTIVAPPSNARKWQMGLNSAFKGLTITTVFYLHVCTVFNIVFNIKPVILIHPSTLSPLV